MNEWLVVVGAVVLVYLLRNGFKRPLWVRKGYRRKREYVICPKCKVEYCMKTSWIDGEPTEAYNVPCECGEVIATVECKTVEIFSD